MSMKTRRIPDKRRVERVLHDVNDVRRIIVKLRYTAPRPLLLPVITSSSWNWAGSAGFTKTAGCTWTISRSMVRTTMAC